MAASLALRPTADSITGSFLVSLHDWSAFQPKANVNLCEKVTRMAIRTFAMLATCFVVLCELSIRIILSPLVTCLRTPVKKQLRDIISIFATALFASKMPFGHIPKIDYLRSYSLQLPAAYDPNLRQWWFHAIETNAEILEVIARTDDYSIEEMQTLIQGKLTKTQPEIMQQFHSQVDFGGALLNFAVRYDNISLLKRLIQKGVPIDTSVPNMYNNEIQSATTMWTAIMEHNWKVFSFLISRNANVLLKINRGFSYLDYLLLKVDNPRVKKDSILIAMAKKLIEMGVAFNPAHYYPLCDEVDALVNLPAAARQIRLVANNVPMNAKIQYYASINNPRWQQIPIEDIKKYNQFLRNTLLPKLATFSKK